MRLATFNVENLFQRAKALNLNTWDEGEPALDDWYSLNKLIQQPTYTDVVKSDLLKIMKRHDGLLTRGESTYILLREYRGELLCRPKGQPVEIMAQGKDDWVGWFELELEPVTAEATDNTARIIDYVHADVLCVVEAENRIGLNRFNERIIPRVGGKPYGHVMLIDGNDDRGIDVGIMTRPEYEIINIRSHIDDTDEIGVIFSRDCAEYEIRTPNGNTVVLLVNHFKSKVGKPAQTDKKRLRQATRVREIYNERIKNGFEYIAILGDLNEPPANPPMNPLTGPGSPLKDIMRHDKFAGDGREGTWGNGSKSQKFDYILMSPELSKKVTAGGIERRGVWGGKNGDLFPHLPTINKPEDAASDHAALWTEFDL